MCEGESKRRPRLLRKIQKLNEKYEMPNSEGREGSRKGREEGFLGLFCLVCACREFCVNLRWGSISVNLRYAFCILSNLTFAKSNIQ